ncbi:MAG: nucleotidyltransferase family protein [Caloramator sp.]|nr:nucleotidyltransferase family protein [Caloramator sp.]
MVNALILAGDKGTNGEPKALLKIKSMYMIEYVIKALRESGSVSKIYVAGDDILKEKIGHLIDGFIKSTGSIMDNVRNSIKTIKDFDTPLLLCTSDIPMISGEAVADFVKKCEEKKLDIGYPIIHKSLNDKKYPDVKRTYVKMKDGVYTGGNIVYMNPNVAENCTKKAELLIEYRKKPLKMGKVLGFTFLLRLALGILPISDVEEKICSMFQIKGGAIETSYPEIGNDVDKESDIDFVNKYIS